MMTKFVVLAATAGALILTASMANLPASAAPLSVTGSAVESGNSNVEFVRRHRRQRGVNQPSKSVPVFIVPGFYWGPAWWEAYWRQNRSRRNCANWFFPC